jgi:hypothetical protein
VTITRYRKKPVETVAVQLRWTQWNEVCELLGDALTAENSDGAFEIPEEEASDTCGEEGPNFIALFVRTVHGEIAIVRHGDWIVPEAEPGRFYPVKPDVFAATYEPAASAGCVPAADRAELRDRIADAVHMHLAGTADIRLTEGGEYAFVPEVTDAERIRLADAVLAVLPAPADRAAEWRAAADALDAYITRYRTPSITNWTGAVAFLRRMADETPPAETASVSPTAVLRATPCDACRHTLNWHRNDVGCTVPRCVCGRFQPPTEAVPAQPGKETEPTPIPDDIASEISTLTDIAVPDGWPKYCDFDGGDWFLTHQSHDGDRVMLPSASDMPLMLRRDAERLYGPLVQQPGKEA